MFSPVELRTIAAGASTLDERLAGGYTPRDTAESATKADRRLATWCRLAADGDRELFRRRLARDGLDLVSITPRLGDLSLDDESPAPAWLDTFGWASSVMTSADPLDLPFRFVDLDHPVAFQELFAPLVAACRQRNVALAGSRPTLLSETAQAAFSRWLLRRLGDLCAPTLLEAFTLFRLLRQPLAFVLALPGGDPQSRSAYEAFVSELRGGGWRDYFQNRPVLARLLATVVQQWTATTAELVTRLDADIDAIVDTFHFGDARDLVTDAWFGLSDPHNGGRAVCVLTFAGGSKVVYKPRDLGIDRGWHGLLRWLEASGAPVPLRAPRVLAREGYGWAEFIPFAPCLDEAQGREFFRRSGAILCLASLLQATDLNSENVIASGEHPVLVDLETLMHAWLVDPATVHGPRRAVTTAAAVLRETVLATGLLPNWMVVPGGRLAGIGGLSPPDRRPLERWIIHDTNTDAMELKYVADTDGAVHHLPFLGTRQLSSADHADEIADGFERTYRFLLDRRPALLDAAGPLQAFKARPVRVVLRPTQLYALLLARSLHGTSLSDGADWSVQFELLSRFARWDDDRDPLWPVHRAERDALARLDIPFFVTRTDGVRLELPSGEDLGPIERPGFPQTVARLHRLGPADLQEQLGLIRQSLADARGRADGAPIEVWTPEAPPVNGALDPASVLDAVRALAHLVERRAVLLNGGAAWIGAVAMPREERSQLRVIGHDLYSGAAGVALFLSALHSLTREDGLRTLALAALAPLRQELAGRASGPRLARIVGIGGAVGLGSAIYGLTQSALLLGDIELLDDARRAATLISGDLIAEDRRLDVIGGAAGAILGLLALYRVSGAGTVLDRAVACGHHLLAKQERGRGDGRAWRTLDDTVLTGFSHGAAGIAYALLRLYEATGDSAFMSAAEDGMRFERSAFSAVAGNWLDLRPPWPGESEQEPPCQWCHGASGIGLARLGGLAVLDDGAARAEIDVALRTTEAFPVGSTDHLCCGNFGRLETLFVGGVRLGRRELVDVARRRARQLLARRAQTGDFQWAAGSDRFNPGFFTGLSGVGYQLLRLAYPEALPSVLLWDPPVRPTLSRSTRSG